MRFKIDVSDRETGEVATLEVESPTTRGARRYLQNAGYIIWATEPVPDSPENRGRPPGPHRDVAGAAESQAYPVFLLSPICRFAGIALLWLSAVALFLHPDFPKLPLGIAPTAGNLFLLGLFLWSGGIGIGWPQSRKLRRHADAQIVCRYCRRRGQVRTHVRCWSNRLWGTCGICGLRWPL